MSDILNAPFVIAILIALTVHEAAHALVANWLGDSTAKDEGRLTLNPVAHLDPLGTLMFLLVHFGWGKPVPVDPRNFRHPRRDSALVALAGPVSNLLMAVLAFFLLLWIAPEMIRGSDALVAVQNSALSGFAKDVLADALFLNLGLMAFNLLPIAPLDGSKVLQAFIPARMEYEYEKLMNYGPYILLGILILERMFNIPILTGWILFFVNGVLNVLTGIVS
jgi:Zn-dependent protease